MAMVDQQKVVYGLLNVISTSVAHFPLNIPPDNFPPHLGRHISPGF